MNSKPTLNDPVPDKLYTDATLSFNIGLFSPNNNLAHS